MKNTTELRKELSKVYKDLREKKITTDEARSIIGVTNTMIKSSLAESGYNRFLGKRDIIPFLKSEDEK